MIIDDAMQRGKRVLLPEEQATYAALVVQELELEAKLPGHGILFERLRGGAIKVTISAPGAGIFVVEPKGSTEAEP